LTDKEARKIYKKDLWKVDETFFHTLVDSIPTDSSNYYDRELSKGHYLKAYTEKNNLKLSITTVPGFDVKIINNNTDLNIQVYDSAGQIIKNAKLTLRGKNLRFDRKTQSYRDKKSNYQGLLKVTYQGFSAYYDLDREHKNSQFKRTSGKLLYSVPVKYVWIPVRFVVFIPIDGFRSLIHWTTTGSIYHIRHFFETSYRKVACLFDDYYCDDGYKFTDDHSGYLVFNKPKYMPGDTVKFKAFIVNKKGRPIDEDVEVLIERYGKEIMLTTLSPYRKGAYEYEFSLHDSLQLILDSQLELVLRKKESKVYISDYFKYEDYELSTVNLAVRTNTINHFKGQEFALLVKGTDENDLNLLDAKVDVMALFKEPYEFYDSSVFIPDTLFHTWKKLDSREETKIVIPDSLFSKADLSYELLVKLSTSDNDVETETKRITYFHQRREVDFELEADSLKLMFKANNVDKKMSAKIFGVDHFQNETEIPVYELPAKIKINPYYSNYLVQVDSMEESISIYDESSLIQCLSERSQDSIHIVINNPRGIAFNYFVYRKNKELIRGYGKSFEFHKKETSKENYFVSLQYLWGGKIKDENYRIPINTKELNVNLVHPSVIYPGQKTELRIEVTDKKGHPVSNVDLTAYSLTKKFGVTAPELPDLERQKKDKEIINNFRFSKNDADDHSTYLDYKTWKVLAGLDSIEYYKFRYPENDIYKSSFNTNDSITQFAPFVFFNGWSETVHVVYIDRVPVYFEWSENPQPYSFGIDSGYHKITIRTRSKEIAIDSLYFPDKKKTIFSIDVLKKAANVYVGDVESKLTAQEKRRLYNYIFPYRSTFGDKYAYIRQGDRVQLLSGERSYKSNFLAGPVDGGFVSFKLIDGFGTWFQHEPMFEYEFTNGLLKMRNFNVENRYPNSLNGWKPKEILDDLVLTEKKILEKWDEKIAEERYKKAKYYNPSQTQTNRGTLMVEYLKRDEKAPNPLNILIFKEGDNQFVRVYPGSANQFYDLEAGKYRLIYFYPGSRYCVYDSVLVNADGLNFIKFQESENKANTEFGRKVNKIIEETIFSPIESDSKEKSEDLNRINKEYDQQFRFGGPGEIISGYVFDKEGNGPLPGVNVIAKGTNIGTVTDSEGYYSLKVPYNVNSLVFSSIGYVVEDVNIASGDYNKVLLDADITALEEIIVVGYSSVRRSNLTASVTTIENAGVPGSIDFVNQLSGKVAGISIRSSSGAPSIRIRGTGTVNFDKPPLYIIDGEVYTGDISELKTEFIDQIEVLDDANATAIYGAKAANGVVLITTKGGAFINPERKLHNGQEILASYGDEANSIRSNFSDYAFWQPRLTTDEDGIARFNVTFPDDVTGWQTFVLAMNDRKQVGQCEDMIKSFKPLMAQLALPRFMVEGDTVKAIGKILNYTADTLSINTTLEVQDSLYFSLARNCAEAIIDTISLVTPAEDSLKVKYFIEDGKGYFDGEQRELPVVPLGMNETVGAFYALNSDTVLHLGFDSKLGEVTIYAKSDVLEVLEEEINYVSGYRYDCNEQLASKLKVLLAQKTIYEFQGKRAQIDKKIEELINKLLKNKTESGLWGWWKGSEYSSWISLHVVEALLETRKQGYDIKTKEDEFFDFLYWNLTHSVSGLEQVRIMKLLSLINNKANYSEFIDKIDVSELKTLNGFLHYLDLKASLGMNFEIDTLSHFSKETMMGNLYYSDPEPRSDLLTNDRQNTLLAYKILRYDSLKNADELARIRNYFLERRNQGYWSNTYESAKIIETILPDILVSKGTLREPQLKISGALDAEVDKFPFETKVDASDTIVVSKTGDLPVYFTAHQSYWNRDPVVRNSEFEITSYFADYSPDQALEAGREVTLIVDLSVKKDAEYVMIEIPIPASCSYASKGMNFSNEAHREYFKDQTSIFCEFLKTGKYRFEIDLLPRYSGVYHLNPAKAELMYFPTFYGNEKVKRVEID
jgi:TonB-dependent SusC/RagA subfamily outer membrane receptor